MKLRRRKKDCAIYFGPPGTHKEKLILQFLQWQNTQHGP